MRIQDHIFKLFVLAVSIPTVFAQNANNWNRFDNPSQQAAAAPEQQTPDQQSDPSYAQTAPQSAPQGGYQQPAQAYPPQQGPAQGGYPHFPVQGAQQAAVPVPATLSIAPGKYVTVRVNNFLSTDKNQAGDPFTATLTEPLVVDGFVVARAGQMVNGRVVESEKAGRVKGTSSMRLELTELNLVDGQQLPLKTQLLGRKGETSEGRDAGAIIGTSAVGAIAGAAVTGGGFGAGMGAIAGGVLGTVGVLVTRGRPTLIYPETALTFRVDAPISISTARSANAFLPVGPQDYSQASFANRRPPMGRPYAAYPYGAYPYAGRYPYYGGGLYFYGGRRYYGRWR